MEEIELLLNETFPTVIAFDKHHAFLAAEIHHSHRKQAVSYTDCCPLALAKLQGIPLLTGDQKWAAIQSDVNIKLIRPSLRS